MLSLAITVLFVIFTGPLLHLIFGKVEQDVMSNARKYFFFTTLSYPFIALYDDGSCILRAQENSRLPMQISIISNIMNVIMNLVLVWIFHWGVAGTAISHSDLTYLQYGSSYDQTAESIF